MRRLAFVVLAFGPIAAHAACFDFSKKVERAMTVPTAWHPSAVNGIQEASGEYATGVVWAAVRGSVGRSVAGLVQDLQTQDARKSDRASDMTISPWPDPIHLAHQKIHFSFTPVPFVDIEWTEDWVFSLLHGTVTAPETVIVAYEKTAGTSYIPHMCGSVSLTQGDGGRTDVIMYEEIKAVHRSATNTLDGIRGTLRKLQSSS